jgi:hypothetical protein
VRGPDKILIKMRIRPGSCGLKGLCLLFAFSESIAFANLLPGLEGALSDVTSLLNEQFAKPFVTTFGLVFDHRAYEPATPLGTKIGVDLGVEVTLVQLPTSMRDSFAAQGLDFSSLTFLPSAKILNFHKGWTDSVDLGTSIFWFQQYRIWSVEMKVVVFNPEEGLTWAVRLSRTALSIPIGSIDFFGQSASFGIATTTWTPQLVVSRKLNFADPYIAVGYQYATGGINIEGADEIRQILGIEPVSATGGGMIAVLGLSLTPPNVGLRLTLEGAYSTAGFNSLGTKIGFSF